MVTWALGVGGAQRVLLLLGEALSDDHDVTVVTLAPDPPVHLKTHLSRVVVDCSPDSSTALGRVVSNVKLMWKLRRALYRIEADVVISFMDVVNFRVLLATIGLKIPVIASERNDPRERTLPPIHSKLRRLSYRWADAVVLQTSAARTWAEKFLAHARTWVIPNPVLPCPRRERERDLRVVGLGRLIERKGFDLLIEAFALIADRHPGWSLEIGGTGPERRRLEKIVRRSGVASRIRFAGLVEDPFDFLSQAAIFVLPSRYEGFPNTLLEAMSCGLAVISTNCRSGPSEIISNEVDGILIDVDDLDALAEALDRLMGSQTLRRELGTEAKRVNHRYRLSKIVADWNKVINAAMQHQRSKTLS